MQPLIRTQVLRFGTPFPPSESRRLKSIYRTFTRGKNSAGGPSLRRSAWAKYPDLVQILTFWAWRQPLTLTALDYGRYFHAFRVNQVYAALFFSVQTLS